MKDKPIAAILLVMKLMNNELQIKMKYFLLFALAFITSCSLNGLGPINDSVLKEINSQPDDSVFVGTWKLDSTSYFLIKENYKHCGKQVELWLKSDKTFELKNAPDFITDDFGEPIKGVFLDASGTWETTKRGKHWELKMDFEAGDLYKTSQSTFYMLFKKDSTIVIEHFIGDGDRGNRFRYYKN
jgi:hypothetical protein